MRSFKRMIVLLNSPIRHNEFSERKKNKEFFKRKIMYGMENVYMPTTFVSKMSYSNLFSFISSTQLKKENPFFPQGIFFSMPIESECNKDVLSHIFLFTITL